MTSSLARQGFFGAAAVVGLVLTWYFNLTYAGSDNYVEAWFANSASTSAAVDLLVVGAVFAVFVVAEGRRIGLRFAWLFIPLAVIVAMAFAVPAFLLVRERRLARTARSGPHGMAFTPSSRSGEPPTRRQPGGGSGWRVQPRPAGAR